MSSLNTDARAFFEACETGRGWADCRRWCRADATFEAQAEPLANVKSLEQYTDWMKGLLECIPDGRYEEKSFAIDEERRTVAVYAVFRGTHTGPGGPCAPTGRHVESDYVYVMFFGTGRPRRPPEVPPEWARARRSGAWGAGQLSAKLRRQPPLAL